MEHRVSENEVIKSFNNQVAGHKHSVLANSPGSLGLVKFGDDCVLKPITKPRQGHTEIKFYQEIWSAEDSLIGLLKLYVPKCHGLVTLSLDGLDTTFLKLQDLSVGLKKPCIADIKIGAQTWEPNVDQQKRITEDLKYAQTKEAYGISVTGYQVFDLTTRQLIRRDKSYGKNLTKDTIYNALKEFFNIKARGSSIVIQHVLQRLSDMLSWWHQQKVVNIYGSSVLILYDAWELDYLYKPQEMQMIKEETGTDAHLIFNVDDHFKSSIPLSQEGVRGEGSTMQEQFAPLIDENCQNKPSVNTASLSKPPNEGPSEMSVTDKLPSHIPWIRVYMIDFAHVVYPYEPKSDHNYIHGLSNLIKLIQNL